MDDGIQHGANTHPQTQVELRRSFLLPLLSACIDLKCHSQEAVPLITAVLIFVLRGEINLSPGLSHL